MKAHTTAVSDPMNAIIASARIVASGSLNLPKFSFLSTSASPPLPVSGSRILGASLDTISAVVGVVVGVSPTSTMGVAVFVAVGVLVSLPLVIDAVGVVEGVAVADAVIVGLGVEVGVDSKVGTNVGVAVGLFVFVAVAVDVFVGVDVAVLVLVGVNVGVGQAPMLSLPM